MNIARVNDFIGQDWEYPLNDCWAVFGKAARAIFGIDVREVDLPAESDLNVNPQLFAAELSNYYWLPLVAPRPGCAAIFYDNRNNAVHIGLYVTDDNILHCLGSENKPGRVTYDSLHLLNRLFRKVEFYRYVPDHSTS